MGGLVEEQETGLLDERAGQQHELLLACERREDEEGSREEEGRGKSKILIKIKN